jgi:hypothetical protein
VLSLLEEEETLRHGYYGSKGLFNIRTLNGAAKVSEPQKNKKMGEDAARRIKKILSSSVCGRTTSSSSCCFSVGQRCNEKI